jgi:AbrB family looped-hinge helix DNA binding protein
MRTTIDGSGRLVVPKAIRERLQLGAGGEVEIEERDGVIEIVPVAVEVEIVDAAGGPVAVPVEPIAALTDDDLFGAIDRSRR